MSSSSKSDGGSSFDAEELLHIGTRCRELRKEKEMLRDSQPQSFELIRRLELHVKQLSEARTEDKKHIQKLERELLNCSQEIDYLQDQLNGRNSEVYTLGEHVHELELKLANMEHLLANTGQLREELKRCDSEHLLLLQELESKEIELQESALCIGKLEESISSLTLDSQCEIESMKLDMIALEQACFKAKKTQEETIQENARMNGLIKELEFQIREAKENIECVEKENIELRDKLTSDVNSKLFLQQIEDWLENKDTSQLDTQSYSSEIENQSNMSKEMREALGPCFSKLETLLRPESNLKEWMESMSHQIRKYEVLVKQLKDELREEKSKAKEEADDLAQEMAELRYQMTGLLEEECKRRACIEQASLQRISELEAQCTVTPRMLTEPQMILAKLLLSSFTPYLFHKSSSSEGYIVLGHWFATYLYHAKFNGWGGPAKATMAMRSAVQTANSDQLMIFEISDRNPYSMESQGTCQYISVTRTS
ncbi:nucleoprotein TPR-like [Populus alba x Populus x berolinensis]|uniref:Nucleoprotein TPR-like n=2 Tax=Populus alba x Populus x berolinensis TaxID=444605 RepID=A0AAD6PWH9_9ROSI|nr:nucleoprotein TPR-like [Populus alba x Populus x berolinensis]